MFISPRVGSPKAPPPTRSPLLGLGAGPALVTSLHLMLLMLHGHVKHRVLVSSSSIAIDHITTHALTLIQTALDDQFLKMKFVGGDDHDGVRMFHLFPVPGLDVDKPRGLGHRL